ncbi:hypothetical protein [Sulfobacillus harzensis]|uniref:Uncharacterized protein n=1 Tax=Sulfobacillus harzensis TaxID=2729629 RepID=A0A7Y0Q487_9FIRM|nr:hypothetical protein [Sulfobacillus harzensis]NMP25068.1 hypothetical protein [Sulfobacillus harzensis]
MDEQGPIVAWVWVEKPDVFIVPMGLPEIPERWINAITGRDAMLRCLGTRPSGGACQRVVHHWHAWFRVDGPFSGYCAAHRPNLDMAWQLGGMNETIPCPCGCGAQAHVFGRALVAQNAAVDDVFSRIMQTLGPDQWAAQQSRWSVAVARGAAVAWVPGIATDVAQMADAYRAWLFEGPAVNWAPF